MSFHVLLNSLRKSGYIRSVIENFIAFLQSNVIIQGHIY